MIKISNNIETEIGSAFSHTIHKTEWTCAAKVAEWINDIIQKKNIPLGKAEVETTSEGDRKRVDIILFESLRSQDALCVIEMKIPYFDPFNEKELKEPARIKATHLKAKYFVTSNFKWLLWFNTERVNKNLPEEEQIYNKYFLSEIDDLDRIEESKYKNNIISGLGRFIIDLYEVHTGKKAEPKLAIDDFLIFRLQEKIKKLSRYYRIIIEDKVKKEHEFLKDLQEWFKSQNWYFTFSEDDYDRAAHQAAYLLVNKILFYNLLQAKRPEELDPLNIPKDLTKGGLLHSQLQVYFDYVLKNIDYETIYSTDFIDQTTFPDYKEVVDEIKELIEVLKRYDIANIGFEIIGRIFEKLIPPQERHNLGQYFTNADIVDLIIRFCLTHENQKVFDPACGAGTFLVRAYQHKKLMNQRLNHLDILKTLWGCDIAKFPAHLSTINLAINDLIVDENYPQIIQEDFFNLIPGEKEGFRELSEEEKFGDEVRKRELVSLGEKNIIIPYPQIVDCVVGNPPYTRQEEIEKIVGRGYKERIIRNALYNTTAKISGMAGIHAYFFVHGTKFLQNGGRFGFIVSNSWLDVDWGKGLQEFFLKNYKIITIIESKVERWFPEADINTCIVILEKCSGEDMKKEREDNLIRFVYLKKPLSHYISPAQDMFKKQKERLNGIDDLIKTILYHNEFYENDELKIFPKKQNRIWDEGFDIEKRKYIGSKWGKYLRVKFPKIYFKLMEKSRDAFVKLDKVADVKTGCYTGINEFFYLERQPDFKNKIEKEFLKPIIRNTKQIKTTVIDPSKIDSYVFVCNKTKQELRKRGVNALNYIKWGENQVTRRRQKRGAGVSWPSVETVKNRKPGWWAIPFKNTLSAQVFMIYVINKRFIASYSTKPIPSDRCFHRIFPREGYDAESLTALLNTTLTIFNIEIYGRANLGLGALKFETMDAKQIPIIDIKLLNQHLKKKIKLAFRSFGDRQIGNIFEELGANSSEELTIDKVKPDRRELDKIIMSKVLGLTLEEQLKIYRSVIDLVKSRIERSKVALGEKIIRKKTKEGIDIENLAKIIIDKIGINTIGKFYTDKVLSQNQLSIKKIPKYKGKAKIEKDLYGWKLYSGKEYITCDSENEAQYLKIFLESTLGSLEKVKIPNNKKYLDNINNELLSLKRRIDSIITYYLSSITDSKLREKIEYLVWSEVAIKSITKV